MDLFEQNACSYQLGWTPATLYAFDKTHTRSTYWYIFLTTLMETILNSAFMWANETCCDVFFLHKHVLLYNSSVKDVELVFVFTPFLVFFV